MDYNSYLKSSGIRGYIPLGITLTLPVAVAVFCAPEEYRPNFIAIGVMCGLAYACLLEFWAKIETKKLLASIPDDVELRPSNCLHVLIAVAIVPALSVLLFANDFIDGRFGLAPVGVSLLMYGVFLKWFLYRLRQSVHRHNNQPHTEP